MRKHFERHLSRISAANDRPPVPPPPPPPQQSSSLDVDIASDNHQRSRRKSWSGVFGGRRDKSVRQTRNVVLDATAESSSVTSSPASGVAFSFPTSTFMVPPNSRWSPTPSPSSIDQYHSHYLSPTKEERGIYPSSPINPLLALTVHLRDTYTRRNANFRYDPSRNPRRVLTKPSIGCKNNKYDNENNDYIIYVNDVLGGESSSGRRYIVQEMLGSGTFGQVVKCRVMGTSNFVGIKVIKNKPAYLKQSLIEADILRHLNTVWDPHNEKHILRLFDTFTHKSHLCLVFELLSVNLYELLKQNKFRGLSTSLIRMFSAQIVDVLIVLYEAGVIHCDLKPENILLENVKAPSIKVIDFGSACHKSHPMYTYIQSRFYRSPEVLLGMCYSSSIDMWSFGCIVAELFLGMPLFPGRSEYNQISRIIDTLGLPPAYMVDQGRQASRFFNRIKLRGRVHYELKSIKQYIEDQNLHEEPGKKYFSTTELTELILQHPMPHKDMTEAEKEKEMHLRNMMVDFLKKALQIDPLQRITPLEAKRHPFIAGRDETALESTATAMHHMSINHGHVSVDFPICRGREWNDMANCVSAGDVAASHYPPQHAGSRSAVVGVEDEEGASSRATGAGGEATPIASTTDQQNSTTSDKNNNKLMMTSATMMGTPPLSPTDMKFHDETVSGLSTAIDVTQQINSNLEQVSVVHTLADATRSECHLRLRSRATEI